jgi:hypothetical protein
LGAAGGTAKPAAETVATIETTLTNRRADVRLLRPGVNPFGFVMVRSTVGSVIDLVLPSKPGI